MASRPPASAPPSSAPPAALVPQKAPEPKPDPLPPSVAELRAELEASKRALKAALEVQAAANDAVEGARARVKLQRQRLMGDLMKQAGGDLDDNFVYVSDEDAQALAAKAVALKCDRNAVLPKLLAG